MAALAIGRRIVAWRDPHSVTLRAYVQLLVDRIKAQPCGPCVHNKDRKAKCLQPRCSRHKCTWVQISDRMGCRMNADGDTWDFGSYWVNSPRDCQNLCEKDNECLAVDVYNKTKGNSEVGLKCRMYREACSNPLSYPASAYRLELHKKMWINKRGSRNT